MKYEYKQLTNLPDSTIQFIDEINDMARDGWRLVAYSVSDGGYEQCLMERVI